MDPFASYREELVTRPPQKLRSTIAGLFKAEGSDFQTKEVAELSLTFEGIPGDIHAGHTRKSGAREPYYERGTEMRNERQLSILSIDEMHTIVRRMEISELKSEWISGNLLLDGIPNLIRLPPRTVLFSMVARLFALTEIICPAVSRAVPSQLNSMGEKILK